MDPSVLMQHVPPMGMHPHQYAPMQPGGPGGPGAGMQHLGGQPMMSSPPVPGPSFSAPPFDYAWPLKETALSLVEQLLNEEEATSEEGQFVFTKHVDYCYVDPRTQQKVLKPANPYIERQMNLNKIRENILKGTSSAYDRGKSPPYTTESFERDVLLVFSNAKKMPYNDLNRQERVIQMADSLHRKLCDRWPKMRSQACREKGLPDPGPFPPPNYDVAPPPAHQMYPPYAPAPGGPAGMYGMPPPNLPASYPASYSTISPEGVTTFSAPPMQGYGASMPLDMSAYGGAGTGAEQLTPGGVIPPPPPPQVADLQRILAEQAGMAAVGFPPATSAAAGTMASSLPPPVGTAPNSVMPPEPLGGGGTVAGFQQSSSAADLSEHKIPSQHSVEPLQHQPLPATGLPPPQQHHQPQHHQPQQHHHQQQQPLLSHQHASSSSSPAPGDGGGGGGSHSNLNAPHGLSLLQQHSNSKKRAYPGSDYDQHPQAHQLQQQQQQQQSPAAGDVPGGNDSLKIRRLDAGHDVKGGGGGGHPQQQQPPQPHGGGYVPQ